MSLISLIATKKFISFVSDGRVTHVEKGILSEEYSKIHKINEKVIVGVAGNFEAAEILMKHIDYFDTENAEKLAHSLFAEMADGKVNKTMTVFIGGEDNENNIYYAGFTNESKELMEVRPRMMKFVADLLLTIQPNI